jgi:hypothetical protein
MAILRLSPQRQGARAGMDRGPFAVYGLGGGAAGAAGAGAAGAMGVGAGAIGFAGASIAGWSTLTVDSPLWPYRK